MKNIIYLILVLSFFISCSSDENTEIQDYTSFVVYHNIDVIFPNCIAGYKKDGKFIKIADLGDLSKGEQSPNIIINNNSINEIFIFSDYLPNATKVSIMFDYVYKITSNKYNKIEIKSNIKGIEVTDKTDPSQYPQ